MSRRRVRGEGTIYFHKPSGRHAAQIIVGVKPDGTPDRRTVYGATPEEVADKLHDIRQQMKEGALPIVNRVTVEEWAEQWLREARSLRGRRGEGLTANTVEVYQNAVRYLTDAYGGLLLRDLTGQHLTDLYLSMRKNGIGARQCEIVHNVAGMMLRAAVKAKLIPRDVTDDVPHPPRSVYEEEPRTLTYDEFRALMAAARRNRYSKGRWEAAFLLAVNAGLGRGELLGVQWGDVDFRNRILRVRRQVLRVAGGGLVTGPLKTAARRRDVPLGKRTLQALRKWRDLVRAGTGLDVPLATHFVFCWYHRGKFKPDLPASPEAVNDAFRKLSEQAGIEDATFHTLRATTVTWLAEAGYDIKTIMRFTGHARVETVARHYMRATEKSMREAAAALDRIMGTVAHNSTPSEDPPDRILTPLQ